MSNKPTRHVREWLQLVEVSGLILSELVLVEYFPNGPEKAGRPDVSWLNAAWERFQVEPSNPERRRAWRRVLLHDFLSLPAGQWHKHPQLPATASVEIADIEQTLSPTGVLVDEDGECLLFGLWAVPHGQGFDRVEKTPGRWRATPQTKVERWMQKSECPFVLLSDGETLRLVHSPPGLPAAWIEMDVPLFFEESGVLDAFFTMLRAERFFGPNKQRLSALTEESQRKQTELTNALGRQVREAVEELTLALDRRDRAAQGEILGETSPNDLYRAAVIFVMRLVFLLFAEERRLLPHGNIFFDEGYELGRLLHQLGDERRRTPETFNRERDAWPRLLALFRLVFSGYPHPDLTLPAYGGDLFDPAATEALRRLERPEAALTNSEVHAILRRLTYGRAHRPRDHQPALLLPHPRCRTYRLSLRGPARSPCRQSPLGPRGQTPGRG